MALKKPTTGPRGAIRLVPFDPELAPRVVSWIRDAREAAWLAPRTLPPITAEAVRAWGAGDDRHPQMLLENDQPVAYGEVNLLDPVRREYWLGHLLVDPDERGRGLGRRLTQGLVARAFRRHAATEVSLVVFPENIVAVQCYRSLGFQERGYEVHPLAGLSRNVRLTRMSITAGMASVAYQEEE